MKKIGSYLLCMLLYLSINGCSALGAKISFGNSAKWLPAKFRPAKTILLVEVFGKPKKKVSKVNKAMAKYLDEKYPYKYEIVSAEDIKDLNGKYSDLSVYPFALVWSKHYWSMRMANGMHDGGHGYDLNFVERGTGKEYPKTGKGCTNPLLLFKPVVNTIVKNCHKN